MARFATIRHAAEVVGRHPRTIENWLYSEFITPFSPDGKTILVDLDQIEEQLKVNPRMRDGRRPRFPKTVILAADTVPVEESTPRPSREVRRVRVEAEPELGA